MGSFSWLKADELTSVANIAYGQPFKFLIPKEFGGGFIKDKYQDYRYLGKKEDGTPKYDMYELLAFWNKDMRIPFGESHELVLGDLEFDDNINWNMKEIDKYTAHNRSIGIDVGCYNSQIDKLKYPLKLVSASFKGCYEDIDKPSYEDPNQGSGRTKRNNLKPNFIPKRGIHNENT